jgi:hypothetical protein
LGTAVSGQTAFSEVMKVTTTPTENTIFAKIKQLISNLEVKLMKSIFVILLLLATLALPAHAEEETCDMLFVQDAKAMTFDGSRMTLKEANPNIIFFCDRPVRTAGHMNRDAFMKLVTEGENSFADNPPNAAVSIVSAKGEVTDSRMRERPSSCSSTPLDGPCPRLPLLVSIADTAAGRSGM